MGVMGRKPVDLAWRTDQYQVTQLWEGCVWGLRPNNAHWHRDATGEPLLLAGEENWTWPLSRDFCPQTDSLFCCLVIPGETLMCFGVCSSACLGSGLDSSLWQIILFQEASPVHTLSSGVGFKKTNAPSHQVVGDCLLFTTAVNYEIRTEVRLWNLSEAVTKRKQLGWRESLLGKH